MPLQHVGIIGARGHYGYALRGLELLPQLKVSAIAEGSSDCPVAPVARWCEEHGQSPKHFADWRRMLDSGGFEAVVVCGPFELHAQMSIDAIERGVHVFVEKPAALSLEDLDRLRAAHQAHPSVHLFGMMGKRYDPGFYTAWQLVRQGAIGDIRMINTRKSYKLGKRDPFYRNRETYGGTIPWVGSHAIDWIQWLGGHEILSVLAAHSKECNEGLGTMERSAVCQFRLTGDRFATASIDLFRPPNAPTHGDDWARIVGTAGVIEARTDSLQLINSENDGSKPVPVACDRQIFRDFIEGIDGTRVPLIDTAQTLSLTEACLLARRSADEERIVRCE